MSDESDARGASDDPTTELVDDTVTEDDFRELANYLRERQFVLQVVCCRGLYLAEIRPEDGEWRCLQSGASFSRAVERCRAEVRRVGRDLVGWERAVLRAGAAVPGRVPS